MRYRHYQNANVDVSVMGLGCWGMGGGQDYQNNRFGDSSEDDCIRVIDTLLENGVNLFDTAPAYGDGNSERVLGRALEGKRAKAFISTKFGIPIVDREFTNDAQYESALRQCEQSLKNLRTDYIDFYFLHDPDPATPIEETMRAFETLKRQGKIRFVGVSNFTVEQLAEALQYGVIDVIEPAFSLVDQVQMPILTYAAERGIDTITYGSLSGGVLSGAYRTLPSFDRIDIRGDFYSVYFTEPVFSRIQELFVTLDEIAAAYGRPVAQVVINYTTQQPFVSTALIGAHNVRKAEQNLAAFEFMLTDAELARITAEAKRLKLDTLSPFWRAD